MASMPAGYIHYPSGDGRYPHGHARGSMGDHDPQCALDDTARWPPSSVSITIHQSLTHPLRGAPRLRHSGIKHTHALISTLTHSHTISLTCLSDHLPPPLRRAPAALCIPILVAVGALFHTHAQRPWFGVIGLMRFILGADSAAVRLTDCTRAVRAPPASRAVHSLESLAYVRVTRTCLGPGRMCPNLVRPCARAVGRAIT